MRGITTSQIGTDQYFKEITRNTIFSRLQPGSNRGFEHALKEISEKSSARLVDLYNDLESNKQTIRFLEEDNVCRIEEFADNLLEAARFTNASPRRTPNEIKGIIKRNELSSRYSMNQIQKAASDIQQRRSADADKELLEAAQAYLASKDSRANRGRNGRVLGSREYITDLAYIVFGEFTRSSSFQRDEKYGRMIENQIMMIVERLRTDIKRDLDSGTKQISSSQRRLLQDVVRELVKYNRGNSSGVEREFNSMLAAYRTIGTSVWDDGLTLLTKKMIESLMSNVSYDSGVWGVGGAVSAALGLRIDAQVMYIRDSKGNHGIILVAGGGAGTPNASAGGISFYNPHAETIFDLEGSTVSAGGSVLWVGGDSNFNSSGKAYSSGTVAKSIAPAEIHGTLTFGKIIIKW